MTLFQHQFEALLAAESGDNYVLTTGTGSGKSLSYIIPIVNHVLHEGVGKGVRAIIVYPMNALANSQKDELEKYLDKATYGDNPPVTFKRYTSQEGDPDRQEIRTNPPDILLTNYVMLDLLLTRPDDCKSLISRASNLRFLVLDELHTYRGRQGADIAMLLRRLAYAIPRNRPHALQFIGTSATMSSEGSAAEQRRVIAEVAGTLFGPPVKPERVIGETLERITSQLPEESLKAALAECLKSGGAASLPDRYDDFIQHPLAVWLEDRLGITADENGHTIRQEPRAIDGDDGLAGELAVHTGLDAGACSDLIKKMLKAGTVCAPSPTTGKRPFAFRLHQFFSRGDTAYATIAPKATRHITLQGQQYAPNGGNRLYPLAFCRECGKEFYVVFRDADANAWLPRPFNRREADNTEYGYLFIDGDEDDDCWPDEDTEKMLERVPVDWLEEFHGNLRLKRDKRDKLPRAVRVAENGGESPSGFPAHFIPEPLPFCPCCGVVYRRRGEASKLSTLGTGGRSTATSILALTALKEMRNNDGPERMKLLDFTDNRQDASLQSGHFNDFVEIVRLRSALWKALDKAGTAGIAYDALASEVFEALNLEPTRYLANPDAKYETLNTARKTFRETLAYRLYADLEGGWRLTSPNLEQLDLLNFEYVSLREVCACDADWLGSDGHASIWKGKNPEFREEMARDLLDYLRRTMAIKAQELGRDFQERLFSRANLQLCAPWCFENEEEMRHSPVAWVRSRQRGLDYGGDVYLSARSGIGFYFRRRLDKNLHDPEILCAIEDMLRTLSRGGQVERIRVDSNDNSAGWQLRADAMIWKAGRGEKPYHNPVQSPRASRLGARPNPFFVELYRDRGVGLEAVRSHEHTAQVPQEIRQAREKDFREGKLPVLFCSPTMELGVDIAELSVVGLRNVPPTPANYAQRSGRAGRSGQAALVFTYCSGGSSHDQYYFRRRKMMVAGVVRPPRIDLLTEDLIRSHVHAIWLSESGESLKDNLTELLNAVPPLPERPMVAAGLRSALENPDTFRNALSVAGKVLAGLRGQLKNADWYTEDWLERTLTNLPAAFESACERWWRLYADACRQADRNHQITTNASRTANDKQDAKRLWNEAQSQMQLLSGQGDVRQGDFWSYRYFASEGFLPGYSFPRLPLSAFIPGRNLRSREGEYLSRPRFLAISEFGPRALIYHEGGRYEVNRVSLGIGSDGRLPTRSAKLCPECGYLHPSTPGDALDVCRSCGQLLEAAYSNLFQMRTVTVRRRNRITSDEEERLRYGYDIRTAVRFAERSHAGGKSAEIILPDGKTWGKMAFGSAAAIWRMNLGWRRRKQNSAPGFDLDTQKGAWEKKPPQLDDGTEIGGDRDEPAQWRRMKVIPYVEDVRNILLFIPAEPPATEEMASLGAALRAAMLVHFQLEEGELVCEPLPDSARRKRLLFYESAEGGAGVLRHLIDGDGIFREIAGKALDICHFDPATGVDNRHAAGAGEDCVAACYSCLLNYGNQPDHGMLDRKLIRDLLLAFSRAGLKASPTPAARGDHLKKLKSLCDSELEKRWLDWLDRRQGVLPDRAQHRLEKFGSRPDFLYSGDNPVAVFVDGPPHDFPERQKRDAAVTDRLEAAGYLVIRFSHHQDWDVLAGKFPTLFGKKT
ncbi:MAG: DEAD/DEAH box helicase [Planctomycetota bacterium]|nr:DEAD/DEAH box helicase [Planctomycetota bacterium]